MKKNEQSVNDRIKILINFLILNKKIKNKSDFAQKIGVSSNTITEILGFRQEVTMDNSLKICSTFNINFNWLLTGSGDMITNFPDEAFADRQLVKKLEQYAKNLEEIIQLKQDSIDLLLKYNKGLQDHHDWLATMSKEFLAIAERGQEIGRYDLTVFLKS